MKNEATARHIDIQGIVQGVGFRPFVWQLAMHYGLKGEVSNTSSGVSIHVEGQKEALDSFLTGLTEKPPPLARITRQAVSEGNVKNYADFTIVKSRPSENRIALISPDVAVCPDCVKELFDPENRRYKYPFINCTNCGPRYTIIEDIPYDRPKTAMRGFRMCAQCLAEYEDPANRRFHAQPNACPDCGPEVTLHWGRNKKITCDDPVKEAARLLKKGKIVAIKGLGGFHLAACACSDMALHTLRKRKQRDEKPFAVMAEDLESINRFATLSPAERNLLSSPQAPIVLLKKKRGHPLSRLVSPGSRYFGVMLPYTPLHHVLMSHGFSALVMTSGNVSEEPICIDNSEAFSRLEGIADGFLIHNRDIYLRSDDSIVRYDKGTTLTIRRSRGYAPSPVFLRKRGPSVLACGGELKNTVCLTKDDRAFISQHIGDLKNLEAFEFFRQTISHLKRILDIEPKIAACDLHPDYMSTGYAGELESVSIVPVQHHHAHIAGCMAENGIDEPVIGLAFDGTGLGTDGRIWGGEVLIAEETSFKRAAHISYTAMPGGNAAVKEPWRMGLSYLKDAFGDEFSDLDIPFVRSIKKEDMATISQMIASGINSPLTSSMGRLFDGVSAICGICRNNTYEGQAAIELETVAADKITGRYDFGIDSGECIRIPAAPLIRGIVRDIGKRTAVGIISTKFHNTVIEMFSYTCNRIRKETGIGKVVLSGGAFQNSILLSGFMERLNADSFDVFTHRGIPPGDGGLSFGQAVVAAAMARNNTNV